MANTIDNRFDQASFDVYEQMESLLVKCSNCQDYVREKSSNSVKNKTLLCWSIVWLKFVKLLLCLELR